MARPRGHESASVPIWLKLSEVDAARMDQVLARPEFAGWTRAEWCLEIIQTALRYYTRPRPAAEPAAPEPARPAPEPEAAAPEPAAADPEPAAADPEPAAADPEPAAADPEPQARPECPHPVDARDYQTGTCAVCGAVLWD